MTDQPGQNGKDKIPQRGRYIRFMELEESLFPDNEGDFASSFMNPRRPRIQSDRPSPFDPRNSEEAYRYVGNRVWTGEAVVYAPPFWLEELMDFNPSQNPSFSQTSTPEVPESTGILPGSPQAGDSSYFGNPQGSGSVSGLQSSRGAITPSSTKKPRRQDKDKFQFVGWNDEAKRALYRWKRILKKGSSFFLHQFSGETEASVRDAWEKYGEEGKRLYEEWEAAEEE
ncbi:hypothetical protein COCCADRAFT_24494 [Bipolaris zeicola 26-R-13]|uniref:Uncharacterized protein n=1 Tax=Cochliobolus carbonum (strain 26-R-13) TaxID=930089 RepID=W6YIU3_COCC2|nr:uncharacterized protein COCCADRAFT_24494 [Bipolaris zeicola 26-R-13]EUC35544.1 hypothetical protein COCCADRAFT_24494 [Bipolaris zeicola 26-R-13]